MKRVLLAGLKHEANTFVPGLTPLESFRRRYLLEGQAVFGPERGTGQEIDGILQVAKEEGIELIPTSRHTPAPRVRLWMQPTSTSVTAWWRGRERNAVGWTGSSSACTGPW